MRKCETTRYVPPEGSETAEDVSQPEIKVTSYAPDVFRYLRGLEGVSEEKYLEEWDLPPSKTKMKLGEGRSMAMFLRSKNLDFMCKTISEVEVDVLLSVLPKYTEHMHEFQNSLLMRFAMLLKVEIKDSVGYILCFGDLFSTCPFLNERWDIKGRVPKPGKYRYFPKHPTSDQRVAVADSEPTAEANHARQASVMAEHEEHDVSVEPHSPSSKDLVTRKDKDLTRAFWVPDGVRDELLAQLQSDYDWLNNNGLMDYSILIGVKYENCEGTTASVMRRRKMVGEGDVAESERRPAMSDGQHQSRCVYHNGVLSVGAQETYYIGIIDMLTVYNVKKKSANFFKTFLWEADTLSTIPPPAYRKRIGDFTETIFPPLDAAKDKRQK